MVLMVAEHVVVWTVVAAAAAYLAWRMRRAVARRGRPAGGCGSGCGTCAGGSAPQPLVTLDPPAKRPGSSATP